MLSGHQLGKPHDYGRLYVSNTVCRNQTWGVDCKSACHCASGTCHNVNGLCPSGCADGWTGDACQEAVPQSKCCYLEKYNETSVLGHSF